MIISIIFVIIIKINYLQGLLLFMLAICYSHKSISYCIIYGSLLCKCYSEEKKKTTYKRQNSYFSILLLLICLFRFLNP